MTLRVECYAGAKADERPVRFQLGERDYIVDEVLDQWYGPDDAFFKVRTDDGNLYILRRSISADEWHLRLFDQSPDSGEEYEAASSICAWFSAQCLNHAIGGHGSPAQMIQHISAVTFAVRH